MIKVALVLSALLSASESFAEVSVCSRLFNQAYERLSEVTWAGDTEATNKARKAVENEHIRIARQHNNGINVNLEGYYVYPMAAQYIGEDLLSPNKPTSNVVTYYQDVQRNQAKVIIQDGLIYQDGKALTTDTEWDFIMSGEGEIYIFKGEVFETHHSSPLRGLPIASASTIMVIGGKVDKVTSQTNHYLDVTGKFIKQFVKVLRENSVNLSETYFDIRSGELTQIYEQNASAAWDIPLEFFSELH